jgi:hypothetical protein
MRPLLVASCLVLVAGTAHAQGTTAAAPAAAATAAPAQPKPGSIAGRVVFAPGVPATACRVAIESASQTAGCNSSGAFILKQVPPGQYDLRISVSGVGETRLQAGVGDDQAVYVGDVIVGLPGAVSGQLTADNSADLDLTIVGIPELGVYTQPNVTGGYLLPNVPAGTWNITVFPPGQAALSRSVAVGAGQPTRKVDFQIKTAIAPGTTTTQ